MPKVAIVGAGLIGRSWAIVFAQGGFEVALFDATPGVAERSLPKIAEIPSTRLTRGTAAGPASSAMARIIAAKGSLDPAAPRTMTPASGVPFAPSPLLMLARVGVAAGVLFVLVLASVATRFLRSRPPT